MSKMGLDSHYRGAVMVSRFLYERGMEVVYIGNQLPDAIVATMLQEDADVLGLSSLSGNHMVMIPKIMEGLKANGLGDKVVVLGGVVPEEDHAELLAHGVSAIFGTGSNLEDIANYIEERIQGNQDQKAM
jgi:methylmalonyl-CoA mutase, C-terminal domain